MSMRDLIPWTRHRNAPAYSNPGTDTVHPFWALHREMNRMFDEFARGFDLPAFSTGSSAGWPHVEVSETADDIRIVAELPGLEEKDIDVTLHDGVLTLRGEKTSESESAVYSERWHGRFGRSMQLGPDVDPNKVSAAFKNGVLTVTLGKRPEAQREVKRIPITGG
ncbi:MAG: Hsp20/alpha crystallin family protein [Alphaproteobacteria bacterium]|nr:Hsp20/alpha crystallin family protein [Alphaproteobacteria bacterium]